MDEHARIGMGSPVEFEAFDLDPRLLQGIKDLGFDELFPIQAEAIAPILQGRDLIGQAHTGSGKTLAYAVPMLQNIDPGQRTVQGLVLVPTRELAVQVAGEFEKLARHLGVRTVPVYGGQSINVQIDRLDDPRTKIIVATPGSLREEQLAWKVLGLLYWMKQIGCWIWVSSKILHIF